MRCDQCGVESPWEAVFQVVRRSFSLRARRLCPRCARQGSREQVLSGWQALGYCSLVAIVLVITSQVRFQAVPTNLALFYAWYIPSAVLHEAGHALAAGCLGLGVQAVVLGTGRVFKRWQWGSVVLQVGVGLGGYTLPRVHASASARWKWALMVAAGPVANLLVVLVLLLIWSPRQLWLQGQSGPAPWAALGLMNLWLVVSSLVPARVTVLPQPAERWANDGLLLWQVLRRRFSALPAWQAQDAWGQAAAAFHAGRYEEAAAACHRGCRSRRIMSNWANCWRWRRWNNGSMQRRGRDLWRCGSGRS